MRVRKTAQGRLQIVSALPQHVPRQHEGSAEAERSLQRMRKTARPRRDAAALQEVRKVRPRNRRPATPEAPRQGPVLEMLEAGGTGAHAVRRARREEPRLGAAISATAPSRAQALEIALHLLWLAPLPGLEVIARGVAHGADALPVVFERFRQSCRERERLDRKIARGLQLQIRIRFSQ